MGNKFLARLAAIGMATFCGGSCVTVTTVNIGQKTSLERQLMGEFEPLSGDQALAASVRAGPAARPDVLDAVETAALAARRRQLFNRDDVQALKAAGCLGESNDASLAARPCDKARDVTVEALRERIIGEENADRQTVINWAIATDPVLTSRERPQVAMLYHRMLLEQASKGEWLQEDDGIWKQR